MRALTEKQLADPSQRIHKVLESARVLYGLIHARYILTAQGLSDMVQAPNPHEDSPALSLATLPPFAPHSPTHPTFPIPTPMPLSPQRPPSKARTHLLSTRPPRAYPTKLSVHASTRAHAPRSTLYSPACTRSPRTLVHTAHVHVHMEPLTSTLIRAHTQQSTKSLPPPSLSYQITSVLQVTDKPDPGYELNSVLACLMPMILLS